MKTYVKPELFYESYELSQSVAACRWDWVNNTDNNGICYATYDVDPNSDTDFPIGVNLFNSDATVCNTTPADREDYCYTNGAQGSKLFQS